MTTTLLPWKTHGMEASIGCRRTLALGGIRTIPWAAVVAVEEARRRDSFLPFDSSSQHVHVDRRLSLERLNLFPTVSHEDFVLMLPIRRSIAGPALPNWPTIRATGPSARHLNPSISPLFLTTLFPNSALIFLIGRESP